MELCGIYDDIAPEPFESGAEVLHPELRPVHPDRDRSAEVPEHQDL